MVASGGRPLRDVAMASRARQAFPRPAAPGGVSPPATLAQWRRYFDFFCAASASDALPAAIPAAAPLLFASGHYPEHHLPHEHVPVGVQAPVLLPAGHVWWLASHGDHVLLNGGPHPRHLIITSLDRDAGSLAFDDPWSASPGGTALSSTAATFERDAVLLATFDTPNLLEQYLETFPEQRGRAGVLVSFGGALLGSGVDEFAPLAASYFDQALLAALLAPAYERECIAAGLYLALTLSLCDARQSPEPLAARPFTDRLYRLLLDQTEAALQRHLSAAQLCRLATASARAQDPVRASRFCQLAFNRDPSDARTRLCRAKLMLAAGDAEAARADVQAGVEANTQRLRELLRRNEECASGPAPVRQMAAYEADEAHRLGEALETLLDAGPANP